MTEFIICFISGLTMMVQYFVFFYFIMENKIETKRMFILFIIPFGAVVIIVDNMIDFYNKLK